MSWRTYLSLGRISNLPTVWTNALAGSVLAGGPLSPGRLILACLALSLFYTGGMFLNDAFDREVDARERPERPIPSGAISAGRVFGLGFAQLGIGLVLLLAAAVPGARAASLGAGAVLAAIIIVYDAWHKKNPVSPLLMGAARAMVYVAAGIAVSGRVPGAVAAGAIVLLAYLIGLTYIAKQENLGRVGNLWPLLFLAAPFGNAVPEVFESGAAIAIFAGFLAWVVYALSWLVRSPRKIPRAVVSLIAGISLLDAGLIALAGANGLAWLAVGGFFATLALQRVVSGT